MQAKNFDLIILGAGPAGITAAVYASRKKLDLLVISSDVGGQAAWSGDIENYTGYQFITGPDLALKFQEHIDSFQIPLKTQEIVKKISSVGNLIKIITDKGEYFSKTLIIATGKRPKELKVIGENKFKNKGLTYCATCDGPLFKDKDIAIIGGGNSALDAALQMVRIASKVYVINISKELTGDPIMIEKITQSDNIEIINESSVVKVLGENFVKAIEVEKNNKKYNIDVEGVFVEIGLIPNSDFANILNLNENNEICIDSYNRTSIDGIFAAGDVTDVPEKQIIIACGEGSKASLSAFRYLATHNFKGVNGGI